MFRCQDQFETVTNYRIVLKVVTHHDFFTDYWVVFDRATNYLKELMVNQ